MTKQAGGYYAYLLRCWEEQSADSTGDVHHWRYAVEEVFGARQRRGFESLDAALAFIHQRLSCDQACGEQPAQVKHGHMGKCDA